MIVIRRKEFEVKDIKKLTEILDLCKIIRIAMADGDVPYIVPVNFGYEFLNTELIIYFHCAVEGKKLDIIAKNNNVCFEVDCSFSLVEGETACAYSGKYASIIGNGIAEILSGASKKTAALSIIMQHQTGKRFEQFPESALQRTTVIAIRSKDFCGKVRE